MLWWRSSAVAERSAIPAAPVVAEAGEQAEALAEPPVASEKTREERRFSRYDKDKDGGVAREEYLKSRRTAFAKLDSNGDGRLSFDEWAVKTTDKFAAADKDKSGVLTPVEFATTRVVRKAKAPVRCPPVAAEEDT